MAPTKAAGLTPGPISRLVCTTSQQGQHRPGWARHEWRGWICSGQTSMFTLKGSCQSSWHVGVTTRVYPVL